MKITQWKTLSDSNTQKPIFSGIKTMQKEVILDVLEDDFVKNFIDKKSYNSEKPYFLNNLYTLRRLKIINNEDDIKNFMLQLNIINILENNDINIFITILGNSGIINNIDDFISLIGNMNPNFNIENRVLINFLKEKIIKNKIDFITLYEKGSFKNINYEIFEKNWDYLKELKGSNLDMKDFTPNMIGFLKCADLDGIDFILEEYKKQEYSIKFNNIYDLIKYFDGCGNNRNKQIIYYVLSFISQPGLYQKVKHIYSEKGEEFNFGEYFINVHSTDNLDDIGKNKTTYNIFIEKYENKNESIDNFKKSLELLLEKFPNIEINEENFKLIENIGENIFLFKYFENDLNSFDDVLILNNFIKKIYMTSDQIKNVFKFNNIDFKLICNNNFIIFINNSPLNIILKIIKLYPSSNDLLKIFQNKINIGDIDLLLNFIIKNSEVSYNLKYLFFKNLNKKYKNFQIIINHKLFNLEKILFNEESVGSRIFNELIELMKEKPEEDLYEIMSGKVDEEYEKIVPENSKKYNDKEIKQNQKRIINYQENSFSDKDKRIGNKLKINENELDLSIYLRYTHTVNSPEVAEYIILFLEKYFKEGNSKYFKNIRIIPRKINEFPDDKLFKLRNIKKYNVDDDFKVALHKNSIAMFLSHSTNSNPYNCPQIVSGSMDKNETDIKLDFDLEKDYCNENIKFIANSSLTEILQEIIKNIQDLEKDLDKIN